jgi:hypothetical protein
MATTAATLIQRTRRLMRDWPETDTTTASVASGGTSLNVADTTIYFVNELLELDQEIVRVTALTNATTLGLQRGLRGTTAASHASSVTVLQNPGFFSIEILDELNNALDACFPLLYRPVATEYTGLNGTTYEWTLPTMSGISVAIPFLYQVEVKEAGDVAFRAETAWEVVRSEAPFIKFRRAPTSGSTIRLRGYGPFTRFTAITDSLDTYFPKQAEGLLPLYAASQLLASGEAGRVRADVGTIDQREQANRLGGSMAASDRLLQKFYQRRADAAMPPMPRHVVSLF